MKLKFDLNLTKKQKEAYDIIHSDECRYLVCRWGRQSGKTVFAEVMLIEYLCKKNTYNAYISPTFQLGRKIYKDICQLLEGKGIISKSNSSTLTIETIYGSTLQCYSIEGYTAIRGTTVSGILVLDEASYYPDTLSNGEEPWANVIMPIIKARKPKTLIISTPAGKRGMFWDFWCKAEQGEKGYYCIKATIMDDSLVTEEDIQEIRKSISEIAWRQEFMVEFLDSAITFFKGFDECFKDYSYNDNCRQWIGIDLSANGQDDTILTKINENRQTKQYKIEGSLSSKYEQMAKIINATPNLNAVYMENNGVGAPMINEVKKLVTKKNKIYEWTTTNASKEEIVSNLAVDIERKAISFDNEDKELYAQLGQFVVSFTKTGKMSFQAYGRAHDDRVMSLAIALKCKEDFKYDATKNINFVSLPNKKLM